MVKAKDKAPIQLPDNVEFIPTQKFQEDTRQRFEKIDNLLLAIVTSVIISAIAVIVAVVGIFIDQLRFNNAAYTDYANRIQAANNSQKINKALLQQITNQQNLILEQQKKLEQVIK